MQDLRVRLKQLLDRGGCELAPFQPERIAVYGAGGCGQTVARLAQANGINVAAFIDVRGDGTLGPEGIVRFSPRSEAVRQLAREGLPVVIGIFNFSTDLVPITAMLGEVGFSRVVSYPEFHETYGVEDDFWLTKRAWYRTWTDEILNGFELFDDEASRAIYYEILAHRLEPGGAFLRRPDSAHHYLPDDLPAVTEPMRLIDCGAYNGDTLRLFVEHGINFDSVSAFEPDLTNYAELCRTANELREGLGTVTLVPCGVGTRTEMLSFRSGGGSGSSLAEHGTSYVQVVALDDALPTFAPTFLKLDIEGAEPDALGGAKKMIAHYKPRLAVCVYHQPEHLWQLPQLIRDLNPSYKLALRYHQWNGFDVVAYAY